MTEATRGKIVFMMPDSWSKEKTEEFADKAIEKMAPKIAKLAKPKKKKEGGSK